MNSIYIGICKIIRNVLIALYQPFVATVFFFVHCNVYIYICKGT